VLRRLLVEIESAGGAVSFRELERRLAVDRDALDGMVEFLVRKGRLRVGGADGGEFASACGDCTSGCGGLADCPFVARTPRLHVLAAGEDD
jgi:hypothetical protein